MSDARTRIAALLLAAVTALFVWWGWKQGAYFGSVFYPGAGFLFLLSALLAFAAPFRGRLRGPSAVAAGALLALALWTLLSAFWSPSSSMAARYASHDFLYLALFVVGIWTVHLLGRRMGAGLAPVALAGALVGIATVYVLATGDDFTWYLHEDATLRFPLGYRNANAAFFLICLWPLLPLAVGGWHWGWRALLTGAGTLMFELAILCQSRGSVPAAAIAALIYMAMTRDRLRAAIGIGLVVLPALPALPTLLEVFRHGDADPAVIPLLRDSAKAILVTTGLSALVAALAFGSVEPRLRLPARAGTAIARGAAAVAALVLLVGAGAFIARHGGPIDFIDQRVDEFTKVGYPDLREQGVRYGANVGSNRHDFWRVAYREGLDDPLRGGGGGSFETVYQRDRLSNETPEDPHSVEALMFGELGLPGLLLFAAFAVGAAWAVLRSRRLGPAAAALSAGALAAGTQWVMQTSYDWLWNYPGVTAPAVFLLGAALAPAIFDPAFEPTRFARGLAFAAFLALALVSVPLGLSARYLQRAYGEIETDPTAAVADLGEAADLNPLDADPLLVRATVRSAEGESAAALADLRQAAEREPENFEVDYLKAIELRETDPAAALAAATRAHERNPRDPNVNALIRNLERGAVGGG